MSPSMSTQIWFQVPNIWTTTAGKYVHHFRFHSNSVKQELEKFHIFEKTWNPNLKFDPMNNRNWNMYRFLQNLKFYKLWVFKNSISFEKVAFYLAIADFLNSVWWVEKVTRTSVNKHKNNWKLYGKASLL